MIKIQDIEAIANLPESESEQWLQQAESSIEFIRNLQNDDEVIIYASLRGMLIHGVLALNEKISGKSLKLLGVDRIPMPDDSWCIQYVWGGGEGHRIYLEAPMVSVSKALVGGEKLIFRRTLEGFGKSDWPIEISQKLIHSLNVHYISERKAYCRLDENGDLEDVIRIINTGEGYDSVDVVVIRRDELDRFMAVSKTSLILFFDFTRVRWGSFGGWGAISHYEKEGEGVLYHGGVAPEGSFCHGAMVVPSKITVDEMVRKWQEEEDPSKKQYAVFKIYDRKNKMNVETSCGPGSLSNYFQKSDLPWEVSPAFFRSEVLARYKMDPDKYSLDDRSISCRNAWYLKTYDINEAGQVHTYIGYLARLPYKEQLYWQAFNEWPKGTISKRAYTTDILGDWDVEPDPLHSLKDLVSKLDDLSPKWWKKRGSEIAEAVRYPATDSIKEWADEILALDQFLVEGLLVGPLRAIAEKAGRVIDKNWGSIRVLQEIMIGQGVSEVEAKEIILPLQRLHGLRSEVRGHAAVEKRSAEASKARTEFKTLRAHFRNMLENCENAFKLILAKLEVNFPE